MLKNIINSFVISCLVLGIATSCSVVMAAKKEGYDISKVQNCKSRGQFLACGATVISSDKLEDGTLVEVYQFKKENGSVARAFMHGLLDVSTLGLWEVIGTPMEACLRDKGCFSLRVYYDENEIARSIELL